MSQVVASKYTAATLQYLLMPYLRGRKGWNCEIILFSLSLHCVKPFVLILSFLLSLFFGVRTEVESSRFLSDGQCNISESPSTEHIADYTHNRDICITAAQGYTFAGNNSTNSVSVRTSQSGRRINPQVRSTFRIVKGGKVIDNNHMHPFLAQSVVHLAGIYISERYLFSICSLRL